MKKLDKEISTLMMKYEDATTNRKEYNVICELEELIKETKRSMLFDTEGNSYFNQAVSIMMNDIVSFMNTYKNKNQTPCFDGYKIEFVEISKKIRVRTINRDIKLHGFGVEMEHIPQYAVMQVVGFDKEDSKYIRVMVKGEFEEFIKIREENSLYFLPFIEKSLDLMNNSIRKRGE